MKSIITFGFLILLALWVCTALFLSGVFDWGWLPDSVTNLKKPATTQEYADSLGITDSLFSSLAVALAVAAVLLQGKEMREGTRIQQRQADSLQRQIAGHDQAALISAVAIVLNHLATKRNWSRGTIERLEIDLCGKDLSKLERNQKERILKRSKSLVAATSEKLRQYEEKLEMLLLDVEKNTSVLYSNVQLGKGEQM